MKAAAKACSNIALVKYWGKRNAQLNLPAAGSLSLTLDALVTHTSVAFVEGAADRLLLNGQESAEGELGRVSSFLDLVRERAKTDLRAEVVSTNSFPTASGLASSASAYAALALAASKAAGLELSLEELSVLARRGSGSAARSIHGGAALMAAGDRDDGSDSYASSLDELADWPLVMVIAIVAGGARKSISSRVAMERCSETSPLYEGWVASVPGDLVRAKTAIKNRNLDELGTVMEESTYAMHAAAMASRPSVRYWRPETMACMATVESLRKEEIPVFFTMDAGPHVKALTLRENAEAVEKRLRVVAGVTETIISGIGKGARLVEELPAK